MAVASFMVWSALADKDSNKNSFPCDKGDSHLRELSGIEQFLTRKIPGSDKVVTFEREIMLVGC